MGNCLDCLRNSKKKLASLKGEAAEVEMVRDSNAKFAEFDAIDSERNP